MSDLRTRLEQLGERAHPASDAFARLERARRHRERNRRITAGTIALLVAVAGSFAAFSMFGGTENRMGGNDERFFALWPESTADEASAAQRDVDDGDPDLQWRLDAEETALRFIDHVLGWATDVENLAVASTTSADGVTVELQTPPSSCPSPPVPPCFGLDVTLRLRQLVAEPGIWSVASVESSVFNVPLHVGDDVELDSHIAIATGLPDGTDVAVGVAGTGACTGFNDQTAEVIDGLVAVPVRAVSADCDGYLYALTPGTPIGFRGRNMFDDREPTQPADYVITAITAIPVRFVAPAGDPPSVAPTVRDTLNVSCDGRDIELDTAAVAAQTGGVRVVVDNASPDALFFQFARATGGPWGGIEVQRGISELVLQAPPGSLIVRCSDGDGLATDQLEVEILNPEDDFVPFDIACPGQQPLELTIPVSVVPSDAEPPNAVEFVRSRVEGLLPSDVVERAGYPATPDPVVRLVRDGAVVGSFGLFRQFGRWEVSGAWCSELDIAVASGPDPYPRGAFEWCPELPFGEPGLQWEERASEAAIAFVSAYVTGDWVAVDALLDESVPAGTTFPIELATGADPLVIATDGRGGELVNFGCGNDVDAYTAAITIDDGTNSASLDFTVYLVFRGAEGWKVWAVY
jgi:hypothetical protein